MVAQAQLSQYLLVLGTFSLQEGLFFETSNTLFSETLNLPLSFEGHQLMFNEHNSGLHITRGRDPGPHCP